MEKRTPPKPVPRGWRLLGQDEPIINGSDKLIMCSDPNGKWDITYHWNEGSTPRIANEAYGNCDKNDPDTWVLRFIRKKEKPKQWLNPWD